MASIITPKQASDDRFNRIVNANARLTEQDYNNALEDYLKQVRSERGYTDREPSDWKDSSVPRWKQDAADWIAFRDTIMLYGLDILNQYEKTGTAPLSLDAFKEALAKIKITWTYTEE